MLGRLGLCLFGTGATFRGIPRYTSVMRPERVGRYLVFDEIAAGGMAAVHLGRLVGPAGFGRLVAVKRLHPHLQREPDFTAMLLDEARIASRIYHPNVVQVLDVVTDGGVTLVLEYVHGEALSRLVREARRRQHPIDAALAAAVMIGVLRGLHAAHETCDEGGQPLGIVHRDVSPHNVLVDAQGTPRLLDFGVAKARGRIATTRDGQLKGKLAYMPPEQLAGAVLDRRADVYAASVVYWELLTGERLFDAADEAATVGKILAGAVRAPSELVPHLPPAVEAIVMRGLSHAREDRWATAAEMADAIERASDVAPPARVAEWVTEHWPTANALRDRIAAIERGDVEAPSGNAETGAEGTESAILVAVPASAPTGGDATSTTTTTTTDTSAVERRRGRGWALPTTLLLAATTTFGAVLAWERASSSRAAATDSSPPTSDAPANATTRVEPAASASGAESIASAAASAAPIDPPSASAAPLASASARVQARPPVKAAPRKPSCDPPWTLDADGNHVWKRECFKR